ncbi:insulinase family protein [Paenibacillus sp. IB182496]|uniref:Insulinase family protein n=1 Tax=Paenibacillus sabuli TaxID=2772509 RepID=A0A927BTG3_9BACL|nr:pitrilysin family protein [Paenibacillus sabuli]MBD2845224.1 insulinase family protein [Paenibacillus sabuli]
MTFERGEVGRIRLHVWPTKRFKTFAVSLYAGIPLDENTVTATALTPFVLRRGTARTPETIAFRERLDEMYGAGFGFDVYKRGDAQIVQFRLDVIHDQFVSSQASLLSAALELLGEVTTDPARDKRGYFLDKYVDAEKNTLQKKLEAIINDKMRYAAERCLEEMCKDEPYRLHPLGQRKDLDALDSASLYAAYRKWLGEACFDLYVVGDTTLEQVQALAAKAFGAGEGQPGRYAFPQLESAGKAPKSIVEEMDVAQGKLNMGLRTHTHYADDDYPAMLMYNGILGGYAHSKLFLNVREKASLAYYAASRLDGHKGLCTIQSGIEFQNYDQASAIIQQQLEAMRQGNLSELEVAQTKAMLTGQLRESQDSAFETIAFDFNTVLSGRNRTAEALIAEIEAVSPSDIVQAASKVELDTIYFLRNRKEAQGGHAKA